MKRFKRISAVTIAMLAGVMAGSATALRAGIPEFYNLSAASVRVDLNAGQTSFECTGYAYDPTPSHTVTFFATTASFMTLDVIPGNPGYFRVHAENLTGAQYGGYRIDVLAWEGTPGMGRGTSFIVGIVPEPGTLTFLPIVAGIVARRRR